MANEIPESHNIQIGKLLGLGRPDALKDRNGITEFCQTFHLREIFTYYNKKQAVLQRAFCRIPVVAFRKESFRARLQGCMQRQPLVANAVQSYFLSGSLCKSVTFYHKGRQGCRPLRCWNKRTCISAAWNRADRPLVFRSLPIHQARTDSPLCGHEKTPSGKSGGRYFQRNQASLFIFRVMELFLRAALFLCSRPLTTALSTALTATL